MTVPRTSPRRRSTLSSKAIDVRRILKMLQGLASSASLLRPIQLTGSSHGYDKNCSDIARSGHGQYGQLVRLANVRSFLIWMCDIKAAMAA
jgi:hypothetical protein